MVHYIINGEFVWLYLLVGGQLCWFYRLDLIRATNNEIHHGPCEIWPNHTRFVDKNEYNDENKNIIITSQSYGSGSYYPWIPISRNLRLPHNYKKSGKNGDSVRNKTTTINRTKVEFVGSFICDFMRILGNPDRTCPERPKRNG